MKLTIGLLSVAMVASSSAALVYNDLWTNGSAAFTGPDVSWSGVTSEVQANAGVDPATAPTAAATPDALLLSNSAGGTLSMGIATGFGTNANGAKGSLTLDVGTGASAGTADLLVRNQFSTSPFGVYGVSGFTITDVQGISSFSLSYEWDGFLAATATSDSLGSQPFLAAVIANGADVAISYSDVYTDNGVKFVTGLPAATEAAEMLNNNVTFATGAATGSGAVTNSNFQGLNGFDIAGDGYDAADQAAVYAKGITFTISNSSPGNFTGSEVFFFSTNGGVDPAVIDTVPEPSGVALLGLSSLALLARRKR